MGADEEREGAEVAVAEFHKKVKDAFEVFDHESSNTVNVREIGTITRSPGCCPTEGEGHDLQTQEEENPLDTLGTRSFFQS